MVELLRPVRTQAGAETARIKERKRIAEMEELVGATMLLLLAPLALYPAVMVPLAIVLIGWDLCGRLAAQLLRRGNQTWNA